MSFLRAKHSWKLSWGAARVLRVTVVCFLKCKSIHVDWCWLFGSFMRMGGNDCAVPAKCTGKYWHKDNSPQAVGQYMICCSCIFSVCPGSVWISYVCVSVFKLSCCFECKQIPFSLTLWCYCAGGGGVFLLCLVNSWPLGLPYLPDQLQSDHQWRCKYQHEILYTRHYVCPFIVYMFKCVTKFK